MARPGAGPGSGTGCLEVNAAGTRPGMEPVPETAEAFAELSSVDAAHLLGDLQERASRVRALVAGLRGPQPGVPGAWGDLHPGRDERRCRCLGRHPVPLRWSVRRCCPHRGGHDVRARGHGPRRARLAAVRSCDGRPRNLIDPGAPDLGRRASGGHGESIRASATSFSGFHDELAGIFGAWAPGAVTNADLSFSTREVARQAPQKLRDGAVIQVAVGIIAASGDLSMDEARYALREAARRAGTSEVGLARTVVATVNEYGND
ncbi:MAG: hypothetical protein JWN97_1310 [Nocardioides sp.]|nr:hypothetical protein [Nocardioides sp.]